MCVCFSFFFSLSKREKRLARRGIQWRILELGGSFAEAHKGGWMQRERVSPSKSVSAQEKKDGREMKEKGETFTLNIYLTFSVANSRYYGMRIKSQTE